MLKANTPHDSLTSYKLPSADQLLPNLHSNVYIISPNLVHTKSERVLDMAMECPVHAIFKDRDALLPNPLGQLH
jgi:hypothetical protein